MMQDKSKTEQSAKTPMSNSEVHDPLSFDDVVEVMKDLKERLIDFSPPAFAYVQPESMAGDYRNYIRQYYYALTQHKNLWKY